jgi:antitoxin component YwqK of YwqJK toxin-antitoxin module
MKRTLLLLTLLVVLSIVSVVEPRFDRSSAATELPLARLTLHDGRLFRHGAAHPFTGFVLEHYPDGTLKSRSQTSKGMLDGVSEGWTPSGSLQVRECFSKGFSNGVRIKWHANGIRQSRATLVGGKLHGPFVRWDEQGRWVEELQMQNGQVVSVPTLAASVSN